MARFRLSARGGERLCGLPHFGGRVRCRLAGSEQVNLNGAADSNRKKTRCKQAGNAQLPRGVGAAPHGRLMDGLRLPGLLWRRGGRQGRRGGRVRQRGRRRRAARTRFRRGWRDGWRHHLWCGSGVGCRFGQRRVGRFFAGGQGDQGGGGQQTGHIHDGSFAKYQDWRDAGGGCRARSLNLLQGCRRFCSLFHVVRVCKRSVFRCLL